MRYEIQVVMSVSLFVIGVLSSLSGLWIILAKEYHQAMKQLSTQSVRISGRAITQDAVAPLIDSASRMVEAINALIRTAAGVGAFLTVVGVLICVVSFWMIGRV
jgi:predicted phage tail protein